MLHRDNPEATRLDFEAWRTLFRSTCGHYTLERAEPDAFAGWLRRLSAFGISAVDVAWNKYRIDRTQRDIRIDGMDLYGAVFQVGGRSTVSHNGQTVQLAEGDIVLVDKARPASYVADREGAHVLCLQFPRRPLISHLGFEPQGGSHKRGGTPAGRLLYELALHALKRDEATFSPADSYMQLAVYDLVGALFVPDSWAGSRPSDKLFARIHGIVRDRFADPDFGPHELAADAGISLRYVHKLFAEREYSCLEFIYSLRVDHAAHLLNRRSGKAWPLSEIAHASGFRDYSFRTKSSAVGSVTRRALTPEHVFNTPATHPCTAVPKTVRRRLTTPDGPAPTVVSRFRRLYPFAARPFTSVGTKGTLTTLH